MTDQSLPLVLMPDFLSEATIEQEVLRGVANVVASNLQRFDDPLPSNLKDAEAILAWHLLKYDSQMLDKLTNTKILVRVGIGVDTVDLRAAGERGIYVANVPDYGVEEVADSAIPHLLNLMRTTFHASYQMNKGNFSLAKAYTATRIRGKTLGLVGFGKIAKAVTMRAKPLGLDIIFYDPYVEDGLDKSLGVSRVDTLKELIQASDILSMHCYLDSKNENMINSESLSWIKSSGCFFINTARGGLVDEDALVQAIKDGRIRGAALDVTKLEPYPSDGPLLNPELEIIMTPHSAFLSRESLIEMRQKAAMEVKRVLTGGVPRNCVNLQYLKKPVK